ncbi:hypothetical protein [Amycolatopsis sp. H20-H5]|uniref:hypothetical protein n=1 Tax=Amycolatopsis sp. H20-H5 TaxID=3046309 RepID=UPI002DBC8E61|nr:hypothetical protein [Amycolatopsis sp. H20-H5]MEC3980605.1 hypothetical protein [Amycolatopsis sp. H20-H5]
MGERFFVDTSGLNRGSGEYDEIGERVRQVATGAVTSAEGLGPVWGNDSAGKKFAQNYLPGKTKFLHGVFALGDVMRATGEGVKSMSKKFENTEEGAARIATKVGEIMPNLPAGGAPAQLRPTEQSPVRPRRALRSVKLERGVLRERKKLGVAHNRLLAMDGYLRGEHERLGLTYSEPLASHVHNGQPLHERVLAVDKKMRTVAEGLGLEYPGITPTEPELREAGRLLGRENQRLTAAQHQFEAKDDQLRAEYERRGLEYESPWGPPVEATPTFLMSRHVATPAPDPWEQAVELSDGADRIREAKDRLVEVDRNLRAASERLGWTYP